MADLTPLQQAGLVVGLLGGVLGVINTLQSWQRKRPRVSVNRDRNETDGNLKISIWNPSYRPLLITHTCCLSKTPYQFRPEDYLRQLEGGTTWIIDPRGVETFTLVRSTKGRLVLLIFWESSGAIILSFIPLLVFRTRKRIERLLRAQLRPEGNKS